jgi:16S rRNA pseudouridine516 synthase
MKLENLVSKRLGCGVRRARLLVLGGQISIGSAPTRDPLRTITRFERVACGEEVLQPGQRRLRLLLHKPVGILSATKDAVHRTVLDLVDLPEKESLHLAGRLDRSSSGLVLLTNDGAWSESLTRPDSKVEKVYLVGTDRPIPADAVARFLEGFAFATEGITTRPARLEILAERLARVTLTEGRYHQIKRMFHRLDGIRLTSLHRERIGPYALPEDLPPGAWRAIPCDEGFD